MADHVRYEDERALAFRQLPADTTAPGEARDWSAKVLARWDMPLADDVQTVVSELVTNALRSGARAIHALLTARWGAGVEVRIWDDGPGVPLMREPDFIAETGRGLFIVDALSAAWGHHPGADGGKVVWARLAPDRSQ